MKTRTFNHFVSQLRALVRAPTVGATVLCPKKDPLFSVISVTTGTGAVNYIIEKTEARNKLFRLIDVVGQNFDKHKSYINIIRLKFTTNPITTIFHLYVFIYLFD